MGTKSKTKKVKSRAESIKVLTKQLKEMEELAQVEELIENNVIKFPFEGVNYRVRKPSPQEKRETNDKKMKKYLELLKDKDYLLRNQWIETYKEKGIDISKMDEELLKLQNEHEKLLLQLAKTNEKEAIEKLKNEVFSIRERQTEISFHKSELLQYSLEDVLEEYVQTYLSFLLLEKIKDEKWIRAFDTYENFMNCKEEKLFSRAVYYLSVLATLGTE